MSKVRFAIYTLAIAAAPGLLQGTGKKADSASALFPTVRFEENLGQTDPSVDFVARARGQQVFLTDSEVVLSLEDAGVVRLRFAGSAKGKWAAVGNPVDKISYQVGGDRSKWVQNAPMFDRVVRRGLYPGVDLVLYAQGNQLEYDLVVAPGADPSRVRLQFEGDATARVSADGSIELVAGGRQVLRQQAPHIYQQKSSGDRRKIDGRFVRASKNSFRLQLGRYERSEALIVDPVLEAASYIGAENDDEAVAVTDGAIAGNTRSLGFPGASGLPRRGRDAFIRGTGPIRPGDSTGFFGTVVFGGSDDDEVAAIVRSASGDIFLAGTTRSTDLPGLGPTNTYKGGATDGFFAQLLLRPNGVAHVQASSYVGGSGEDRINGLATNGSLFAMVGVTDSQDLASNGAPQSALRGGKDAFYATRYSFPDEASYGYLGGSGDDAAYTVVFRRTTTFASMSIWVAGETRSSDFPFVEGGLQGPSDGFLGLIQVGPSSGETRVWRIGGSGDDSIRGLARLATNFSSFVARPLLPDSVGFTGTTSSPDLPVRNAHQPQFGGESDAFVGAWDSAAAQPAWLTYVGGSGPDTGTSILQAWSGEFLVGGWTGSSDLPVKNPLQAAAAGGEDGFFGVLDQNGAAHHLSYFGGSGDDRIYGVGSTASNQLRLVGVTASQDLPQRGSSDSRGSRSEGFVADVGIDILLGPNELILAKDSRTSFTLNSGRTDYGVPVTYQSSDPSRVRFVYLGRTMDQVSAGIDNGITVEALAEDGEVEITASAEGYSPKKIRVRLYPGAYVITAPSTISTWGLPQSISATYLPLDPATGQGIFPLPAAVSLRPDIPAPTVQWFVSDPAVLELSSATGFTQMRGLKRGEARLTATVEGYRVLNPERLITVAGPVLQGSPNIRIGKDLQASLSFGFTVNGSFISSGQRGVLTARSGDPSRLLLSTDSRLQGRERVTITLADRNVPLIFAQALAGDGQVDVFFTSTEFEGEVAVRVTLEPAVIRWGFVAHRPGLPNTYSTSTSLVAGQSSVPLDVAFESESGSMASLRPGAPEIRLTLTNSNPRVLEVNRLTLVVADQTGGYQIRPLAPGTAELSLSVANNAIRVENRTVTVTATSGSAASLIIPTQVLVGRSLQNFIAIRYRADDGAADTAISVASEDPSAAVVSLSRQTPGSGEINVPAARPGSDEYQIWIQGLKGEGETRLRLRFPDGVERYIKIILAPAGVGFSSRTSSSFDRAFDAEARVGMYALDPKSKVGLQMQSPAPGASREVRLRTEGAPIRLSRDSVTLTVDSGEASVGFTYPDAGAESSIIASIDSEPGSPALNNVLRVRRPHPEFILPAYVPLTHNEVRGIGVGPCGASNGMRATSANSDRLLVSATPTDVGSDSAQLVRGSSTLYLHALASSGTATLHLDCGGYPATIAVAFGPMLVSFSQTEIRVGTPSQMEASLNVERLRPGTPPIRVGLGSANTAVANVSPNGIEFTAPDGTRKAVSIIGVAPGTTQLVVDAPQDVYVLPNPVTVRVAAQTPITLRYELGRGLQGQTYIDLGPNFQNPSGAILTITSSDPARLRLSRTASAEGSESVSVTVPARDFRSQPFYMQAQGAEGPVRIEVLSSGTILASGTVNVVASWFQCTSSSGGGLLIEAGSTGQVSCQLRFAASGQPTQLDRLLPIPRYEAATARLSSTEPGVFTVEPAQVAISSSQGLTLRGIAVGRAELLVEPPDGFGPGPEGSGRLSVEVMTPMIGSCQRELVVGKDQQTNCSVAARQGVVVTATSQDPSMVLLSTDASQPGSPAISLTIPVTSPPNAIADLPFWIQGVASHGTAEILLTAPGYRPRIVPVTLRPAQIRWNNGSPGPIRVRIGDAVSELGTSMDLSPRPGASLTLEFSVSPVGIVSIEPVRRTLVRGGTESVQIKGLAAGAATVRVIAAEGYIAPPPRQIIVGP